MISETFMTPSVTTVAQTYPLSAVWAHEDALCQARQWLDTTFNRVEEIARFDYTHAYLTTDNITYPSGIVFLYPEDYIMFKLKFPELVDYA